MRISFDSRGGFDNAMSWLKRVSTVSTAQAAERIAKQGVDSLKAGTPKDTGETASGWSAKVTTSGNSTEISWINTAHPEAGVNLARLIDLGHGTGTGGYVPPKPYIKKSMTPVWNNTDRIIREMIK